MTLTVAWWLHERVPDNLLAHSISAIPLLHVALAPYDVFTRATSSVGRFNRGVALQRAATSQYSYMVRHGMSISSSSASHFAQAGVGRARTRLALRLAGKAGARLIPGLGWALLAYDVYTVTNMILDD